MTIEEELTDLYNKTENPILLQAVHTINNLTKALEFYKRERDRFSHAKPEITGNYFLAGGYGNTDENMLPQYIRICPAYGAGWEQIYEKTNRTVSYEGS